MFRVTSYFCPCLGLESSLIFVSHWIVEEHSSFPIDLQNPLLGPFVQTEAKVLCLQNAPDTHSEQSLSLLRFLCFPGNECFELDSYFVLAQWHCVTQNRWFPQEVLICILWLKTINRAFNSFWTLSSHPPKLPGHLACLLMAWKESLHSSD